MNNKLNFFTNYLKVVCTSLLFILSPILIAAESVMDLEIDSDGDGVIDINDAFPSLGYEWSDMDNDGLGDNYQDYDIDGDGISNFFERKYDYNPLDKLSTPLDLNRNNIPDFYDGDFPLLINRYEAVLGRSTELEFSIRLREADTEESVLYLHEVNMFGESVSIVGEFVISPNNTNNSYESDFSPIMVTLLEQGVSSKYFRVFEQGASLSDSKSEMAEVTFFEEEFYLPLERSEVITLVDNLQRFAENLIYLKFREPVTLERANALADLVEGKLFQHSPSTNHIGIHVDVETLEELDVLIHKLSNEPLEYFPRDDLFLEDLE